MDREKLLYAMGEVDDDVLYFKYHLKNVLWALLMGLITMITCLYISERVLGVSGVVEIDYNELGHAVGWSINRNRKPGLWFQWICLIVIPLLFAGKVRWRYTWVNLFLYFGLYFPMRFFAQPWPCMGYMGSPTGWFSPPWIVYPFIMMFHFWGVQSLVYLAYNGVRGLYKLRKQKVTDKGV